MAAAFLLDSHLHLQDPRLKAILPEVLRRARDVGIGRLLCNATREDDWPRVLELGEELPEVLAFVGVHPWHADRVAPGWEKRLEGLVAANRCGIGEAGLDGTCRAAMAQQAFVLQTQLDLAVKYRRPISLHCGGSWGRMVDVLEHRYTVGSMPRVMLHAFNGSIETMRRLAKIGCWFSFSAGLVDPDRHRLREVFREVPLKSILLETDAPDQLPADVKKTGGSDCNEPANIVGLYRQAADLRRLDLEEFTHHIWHNGEIFTDSLLPR